MQQWLKAFILVIFLSAAPAWAQEEADKKPVAPNKNNTQHVLKMDACEFEITFPGEPYNTRRCDPENPDKCSKIVSYTKTFGLEATVNFNVSCNPAEEGMFDKYSGEVMKATLAAMVGKDTLSEMKTDVYETENFKQSIIVGTSKTADDERIYSAQIWIGRKSIFTIEGEVIGYAGPDADTMFADVLASARYAADDAAPQKEGEEAEEKDEEKSEEKPKEEAKEETKEEPKKP